MGAPPTVSSVPAVMDYLVILCSQLPDAGNSLQILDGVPAGQSIPQRMVIVGSIEAESAKGTVEWSAIGHYRREENYTVDLHILVAIGGTSQSAARDDAFNVYAQLDRLIVQDPSLGGNVGFPAIISDFALVESTEVQGSSGRFAHLLLTLQVKNRITTSP